MGNRKKLVLASLVSVMIALSFAIGLVPGQLSGPATTAKAASGATQVAISADGVKPVGDHFSIPVGGEQSFTALSITNGVATRLIPTGEAQWSLATDGSAALTAVPGDLTATVSALSPGEAGLYVSTGDGLSDLVNLTLSNVATAKTGYGALTSVDITQPRNGSVVLVPTGATGIPFMVTSTTDNPSNTASVSYSDTVDGPLGSATVPPYAVSIPDVTALPASPVTTTITAVATAVANYPQVTAQSSFTVQAIGADQNGDGLPDNLSVSGLGQLQRGDTWVSGQGGRHVYVVGLGLGGSKAVTIPTGGVSVTIPASNNRTVVVTAPPNLLPVGQLGLLVVETADDLTTLLGATEAGHVSAGPGTLVSQGQYVEVAVLVSTDNGTTYNEIGNVDPTQLQNHPLTIEMTGLTGLSAGANARFFHYPTTVAANPTTVTATAAGAWTANAEGTVVTNAKMTAELTSLSLLAPYSTPTNLQISSVVNTGSDANAGLAQDYSIGGASLNVTINNLGVKAVTITIDGQTASQTAQSGDVITVKDPAAQALSAPAASHAVDVKVVDNSDATNFDVSPGGFTYVGPTLTSMTPTVGSQGGGTSITVNGAGLSSGLAADLGGATVSGVSVSGSTKFTGTTTAHSAMRVDLTVTLADNYTGTLAGAFVYSPDAPVITNVSPDTVYSDGGYTVRVTGQNFVDPSAQFKATSQTKGFFSKVHGVANPATDNAALAVNYLDDTHIDLVTPAVTTVGLYSVYIQTAVPSLSSTQESNLADITFVNPATATMHITGIVPNQGPLTGGNEVVISGSGFPTSPQVSFGNTAATVETAKTAATSTAIYVTAPTSAYSGGVDVRVQDPVLATNFAISRVYSQYGGGYTYRPGPVLSSMSPANAWVFGGTIAHLKGAGLEYLSKLSVSSATIMFGSTVAQLAPVLQSATDIYVIVPPLPNPPADLSSASVQVPVTAVTPQGVTNALTFTYNIFNTTTENFTSGPGSGAAITTAFYLYAPSGNAPAGQQIALATDGSVQGNITLPPLTVSNSVAPNGNVFGLVRATKTPDILGTQNLPNTAINNVWNFDVHLYGGTYPFTELNVVLNTADTPITLTYPTNDTLPQIAGTAALETDAFPSTFAYAFPSGAYSVTNTTPITESIVGAADRVVSGNVVTQVTSRLFHLSAIAVRQAPGVLMQINSVQNMNPGVNNGLAQDFSTGGASVDIGMSTLPVGGVYVTIDGVPAPISQTVGTTLTVTVPAANPLATPNASNVVQLQVFDANDPGNFATANFTYLGPIITGISPGYGTLSGGTNVTVTGEGFGPVSAADLGGAPLSGISGTTATQFTATTSAHSVGAVSLNVTLTNNYTGTLPSAYLYTPAGPQLSSIYPDKVYMDGGYTIRANGSNFIAPGTTFKATAAPVGYFTTTAGVEQPSTDNRAIEVDYYDDHTLDLVTPVVTTEGQYNVYVGTSINAKTTDLLTSNMQPITFYNPANATMHITSIVPNQGPMPGGNLVTINGDGFPVGGPAAKVVGNVLRVANAYSVYGTIGTVGVSLYRGANVTISPAAIDATFTFDTSVLTPRNGGVTDPPFVPDPLLNTWYSKVASYNAGTPGQVSLVISGGQTEITTFDDQRFGGTPTNQTNPFPLGTLRFDVVGSAGASTPIHVTGLSMADKNAVALPAAGDPSGADSQDGSYYVGSAPAPPPAPVVHFGINQATVSLSKTAPTSTALEVTVPPGEHPKAVDVRVESPTDATQFAISRANQVYATGGGYTYNGLHITSVTNEANSLAQGYSTGGDTVDIAVTNLPPSVNVTIDGVAATQVSSANGVITVTTPPANTLVTPASSHAVDVVVTDASNASDTDTLAGGFTYVGPSITAISPALGNIAGGTTISVTGAGLASGLTADLGGAPLSGVTVASSTQFTGTTGAHAAGAVALNVQLPNNYTGTASGLFAYVPFTPLQIVSVTNEANSLPQDYSIGGGTLDIVVNNPPAAVNVTIDGVSATVLSTGNTVKVTAPAAKPLATPATSQAVDVTVTDASNSANFDTLSAAATNHFSYVGPTITAISPNQGPAGGGTPIIVTGAGFEAGLTADLDTSAAPITGIAVSSSTQFTGTTSGHIAGLVPINVQLPSNYIGTQAGAYTYVTTGTSITSITPARAWVFGGVSAHIVGTGFDSTAIVKFSNGTASATAKLDPAHTADDTATDLYVIVPPLPNPPQPSDLTNATISANVTVQTTTGGLSGPQPFTYVVYNTNSETFNTVTDTVYTTAFYFTAPAGGTAQLVNQKIALASDASTTATFNVPSVPSQARKAGTSPVFGLVRASKDAAVFGIHDTQFHGQAITNVWNFDVHLYDGSSALAGSLNTGPVELNGTVNTAPMTLQYPVNGTTPLVNGLGNPVFTTWSRESDYDPLSDPQENTGVDPIYTVDTSALPPPASDMTNFQSQLLPTEFDNSTAPATVTVRLYHLCALALRHGTQMPDAAVDCELPPAEYPNQEVTDGATGTHLTGHGLSFILGITVETTGKKTLLPVNMGTERSDDTNIYFDMPDFGVTSNTPGVVHVTVNDGAVDTNGNPVGKVIDIPVVIVPKASGPNLFEILLGALVAAIGLAAGGHHGGGGGGPCFIATAAYGTPMAQQIDVLRQFRDVYMLNNALGSAFVDAYYHASPPIANVIAHSPVLAAIVRAILTPIILFAKMALALPYLTVALSFLTGALAFVRRFTKVKKGHKA